MLFLPLIAVEQWLVVIVLFYFALKRRKATINAQANFQIHTTVWPETGTSSTLRLKVLILLPGAAELSVLLIFFSFFSPFLFFPLLIKVRWWKKKQKNMCTKKTEKLLQRFSVVKQRQRKTPFIKRHGAIFFFELPKSESEHCFLTLQHKPTVFPVGCPEVAGHGPT